MHLYIRPHVYIYGKINISSNTLRRLGRPYLISQYKETRKIHDSTLHSVSIIEGHLLALHGLPGAYTPACARSPLPSLARPYLDSRFTNRTFELKLH